MRTNITPTKNIMQTSNILTIIRLCLLGKYFLGSSVCSSKFRLTSAFPTASICPATLPSLNTAKTDATIPRPAYVAAWNPANSKQAV
jgi:hypothetical protein